MSFYHSLIVSKLSKPGYKLKQRALHWLHTNIQNMKQKALKQAVQSLHVKYQHDICMFQGFCLSPTTIRFSLHPTSAFSPRPRTYIHKGTKGCHPSPQHCSGFPAFLFFPKTRVETSETSETTKNTTRKTPPFGNVIMSCLIDHLPPYIWIHNTSCWKRTPGRAR